MDTLAIAREVELIFGFQPETCIPFPAPQVVEDEMAGNEIVTVKNVGKRLALVNGAYLYPGETARVPHSAYEAAKASGHPVVLEIEEGATNASQSSTPTLTQNSVSVETVVVPTSVEPPVVGAADVDVTDAQDTDEKPSAEKGKSSKSNKHK